MERTGTVICLALLASCWKGGPKNPPTTVVGDVSVELASVNLGDDCGGDASAASPVGPSGSMHSSAAKRDTSIVHSSDAASSVAGDVACVPTSMQLTVAGKGTGETALRVKSVVLVDHKGHVIGNLKPGKATHWANEAYVDWNQTVRGGDALNVSYKLLGLDWSKVPGGRMAAQDRTFTLRVTVEVGTGERTIDKSVAMPKLSIEPGVVT
jgi:hypothetical protein